MNLTYLRSLYFKSLKGNSDVSDEDIILADKYLNIAYKEIFISHHWIYRKRFGQITIIPRYTTGTCMVTEFNGTNSSSSKTVTFSGSSLTQSMVGRYFRVQGSDIWHKIIYISGSTVYLDSEIIGVNGGGKTFEIWERFYYIKSDAADFLDFGRSAASDFM